MSISISAPTQERAQRCLEARVLSRSMEPLCRSTAPSGLGVRISPRWAFREGADWLGGRGKQMERSQISTSCCARRGPGFGNGVLC